MREARRALAPPEASRIITPAGATGLSINVGSVFNPGYIAPPIAISNVA